jgi:uncharacterized membrane protein YecN with MAPEG domain
MATLLYTGCLGLLYLWMTFVVIRERKKHQIAYGHGPNQEIAGLVSAHSNFAAYVPLVLLMLFFLEERGIISNVGAHFIGASLLLGRILHFLGLSQKLGKSHLNFRVAGMMCTILALGYATLRCLLSSFLHGAH